MPRGDWGRLDGNGRGRWSRPAPRGISIRVLATAIGLSRPMRGTAKISTKTAVGRPRRASRPSPVLAPGLAAVTLLYAQAGLRITMKRARIPRPGEPDALTKTGQGRVERAAARRGVRDRAIVATLLYAGARAEECGRLDAGGVTLTARAGHIRLHGKGFTQEQAVLARFGQPARSYHVGAYTVLVWDKNLLRELSRAR